MTVPPLDTVTFDVGGRSLVVRVTGQGDPVVLVPGLGVSGRYMIPTARELAPIARVYVPDLPGQGDSDPLPGQLTVRGLAAALAAWCDLARVERPLLVGNSFGCQVIARLAAERPDLCHGVVLVGPTVDRAAHSLPRQALRWLADVPREPLALVPVVGRDYLTTNPVRQWAGVRAMFADRIADALPAIQPPVIAVRGSRDPIVPQRWIEEVASLAADGSVAVVDGAAHAVNFSHPRELAGIVRRTLRRGP